jgi:GTPase
MLSIKIKKKKKIRKARKIKAEKFDGNIEYKLRLCDLSNTSRLDKLITQLHYRLYEGDGKAIYNIGYNDNGFPHGIVIDSLYDNLKVFHKIADAAQCTIFSMNIMKGIHGYCANIYLGKNNTNLFDDLLAECY